MGKGGGISKGEPAGHAQPLIKATRSGSARINWNEKLGAHTGDHFSVMRYEFYSPKTRKIQTLFFISSVRQCPSRKFQHTCRRGSESNPSFPWRLPCSNLAEVRRRRNPMSYQLLSLKIRVACGIHMAWVMGRRRVDSSHKTEAAVYLFLDFISFSSSSL